jgi:hypothetical protein
MKRLLTIVVIFAVLAVCAPSNAYTLIYKMSSTIKTVETDANVMMNVKVEGYLAISIDDVEETADDARMVIYGKDSDANKMYYIETFEGNPFVHWTKEGAYVTVDIRNHLDPFYYDFGFSGKIKERDVGFGSDANGLRNAASSLKGSLFCNYGSLLDPNQTYFGSGSASMTLDIKKTQIANDVTPSTLDQIMIDITLGDGGLVAKGYHELILED